MSDNQQAREQLVSIAASLFERGYAHGSSGNISMRLEDGTFLATPTNSSFGRLDPLTLSHVAQDGITVLEGGKPTKEWPIHLSFYRAQPGCNGIVHLHSAFSTALSCLQDLDSEDVIRPFTPYFVMKAGKLPLVPYCKPGSQALFDAVASRAHCKCVLLANHGMIASGKNLIDATNTAEELEQTCKLMFLLRGEKIRYLTPEQIAELM